MNRTLSPTAAMALGTAASRVTGFARTVAIAAALGVTAVGDAFNTANVVPTMVFTVVAGGALSAGLIPALVGAQAEGRGAETASSVFTTSVLVAVAAALLVVVSAPLLAGLLTSGAASRPGRGELVDLVVDWLVLFSPQIPLYAVSVASVAVMTAHGRLGLGAVAPVATNVLTILVVGGFLLVGAGGTSPGEVSTAARWTLGIGSTLAVAAMAAVQLAGARRCEPGLRLRLDHRDPHLRRFLRSGSWMVVYVIANQVGFITVIAVSSLAEGANSAYQWAFAVMQLPYAVVSVSLISAASPAIARRALDSNDVTGVVASPAVRSVTWLTPAAVVLLVAGSEVASMVVGTGDGAYVGVAVTGFACSLLPFALFQLLTRTSYAVGDTRTPALVNLAVNAATIAAAFLTWALADSEQAVLVGLTAGHAASYVIGVAVLSRALRRRGVLRPHHWLPAKARLAALALAVAAPVWLLHLVLPSPTSVVQAAVVLGALSGAALGAWALAARLLRLPLGLHRLVARPEPTRPVAAVETGTAPGVR